MAIQLPANKKKQIENVWESTRQDLELVAKRMKQIESDYFNKIREGNEQDFDSLVEQLSVYKDSPRMSRFVADLGITDSDPEEEEEEKKLPPISQPLPLISPYRWKPKIIAALLNKNPSTISRTIQAMEKDETYASRVRACRRPVSNPSGAQPEYVYTDEIIALIMDYYPKQFIETRIVRERRNHNKEVEPEIKKAIWDYWEQLIAQNPLSLRDYLEKAKSTKEGIILTPDTGLPFAQEKSATGGFKSILLNNKSIMAVSAMAVGFADLTRKIGPQVFYIIGALIFPIFAYYMYKAVAKTTTAYNRNIYIKYAACLAVAAGAWVLAFTGSYINGDVRQSAISSVYSKLSGIEASQQRIEQAIINEAQQKAAGTISLAQERAQDARAFIDSVLSDSKQHDSTEYERIVNNSEDSLVQLRQLEADKEKVELLTVLAETYILWGQDTPDTALSKYETARKYLIEAAEVECTPDAKIEIYSNLGNTYILEGDIRSKQEMFELTSKAYENAAKFLEEATPKGKADYYEGMGHVHTIRYEMAIGGADVKQVLTEGEKCLNDAIASFNAALSEMAKYDAPRYRVISTTKSLIMTKRMMLDINRSLGRRDGLKESCYALLQECEEVIKTLNLEKEQEPYVYYQQQYAGICDELFGILDYEFGDAIKHGNYDAPEIIETRNMLDKGIKAIDQAIAFNGDNLYVNNGDLLSTKARLKLDAAIVSDKDVSLYQESINLYDEALASFSESIALQQHLETAAGKAFALMIYGGMLKDIDIIREANEFSTKYLDKYSGMKFKDSLKLLEIVKVNTGD